MWYTTSFQTNISVDRKITKFLFYIFDKSTYTFFRLIIYHTTYEDTDSMAKMLVMLKQQSGMSSDGMVSRT